VAVLLCTGRLLGAPTQLEEQTNKHKQKKYKDTFRIVWDGAVRESLEQWRKNKLDVEPYRWVIGTAVLSVYLQLTTMFDSVVKTSAALAVNHRCDSAQYLLPFFRCLGFGTILFPLLIPGQATASGGLHLL
jgi:hypothetical protein